jgi:peroxiredoxin
MPRVPINAPAPDFSLKSFNGETVRLSEYRGKSIVLLVFNRGFV